MWCLPYAGVSFSIAAYKNEHQSVYIQHSRCHYLRSGDHSKTDHTLTIQEAVTMAGISSWKRYWWCNLTCARCCLHTSEALHYVLLLLLLLLLIQHSPNTHYWYWYHSWCTAMMRLCLWSASAECHCWKPLLRREATEEVFLAYDEGCQHPW
jgi:hypothetical protein